MPGSALGPCLALVIALMASILTHSEQADVVVGFIGPMTGWKSVYGVHLTQGLNMSFAVANAAGGVYGRSVGLVIKDDVSNTTLGFTHFWDMIDHHNVSILAALVGGKIAQLVAPHIVSRKIPYVGAFADSPVLRTPFRQEFINVRVTYSDELMGQVAFLVQYLHVQRVACVYTASRSGEARLEQIQAAMAYIHSPLVAAVTDSENVTVMVDAMLGNGTRPQAVILAISMPSAIAIIRALKDDPRWNGDCVFLMASVAYQPTFARYLPVKYWGGLYWTQGVPSTDDQRSGIVQQYRRDIQLYGLNPEHVSSYGLEGYIVGRFIVEVLRAMPSSLQPLGRQFVDTVYNTRAFVIDDLTLGLFNGNYSGCETLVCECNQGLRKVFVTTLNATTGGTVGHHLPGFDYPPTLCSSPMSIIKAPYLFAQLVPKGDPVWGPFAAEVGRGIQAAFAEANGGGGLEGHLVELIPHEYTGDARGALLQVLDRYPVAGTLGSVVPSARDLGAGLGLSTIATHEQELRVELPPIVSVAEDIRMSATAAVEFMALVAFALDQGVSALHLATPDTSDGRAAQRLLRQTGHTLGAVFQSDRVYSDAADALTGLERGMVVAVGSVDAVQEWVKILEAKPELQLLTLSRAALPVLSAINNSEAAQRLYFPWVSDQGVAGTPEGWAWLSGYLTAQVTLDVLRNMRPHTNALTRAPDLLDKWRILRFLTIGNFNLYFTQDCSLGVRELVVTNARGTRFGRRTTQPNGCHVEYSVRSYTLMILFVVAGAIISLCLVMLVHLQCMRRNNSAAPKDSSKPFAVVFTDIQSSTELWAAMPGRMPEIVRMHHTLIRNLIKKHCCYEVKTVGDSFMVVVECPKRALAFALDLQKTLFMHDWGTERIDQIYASSSAALPDGNEHAAAWDQHAQPCWNGLRVRVGIHYGMGNIVFDPVTKGYDYYGTVVNVASRIEALAQGGQICVSAAIQDVFDDIEINAVWDDLGLHYLRGIAEAFQLYQVSAPGVLTRRSFRTLHTCAVPDEEPGTDMVNASTSDVFSPSASIVQGAEVGVSLKRDYWIVRTAMKSFLAGIEESRRKPLLKMVCDRFQIPWVQHDGDVPSSILHALVMRLLPSAYWRTSQSSVEAALLRECTRFFDCDPDDTALGPDAP